MTTEARHHRLSSRAAGFSRIAAFVMVAAGAFQLLMGFATTVTTTFYANPKNYAFEMDLATYGWIHVVFGLVLVAAGIGIAMGQAWARWTGIALICVSMLSNFLFIPYYPAWSIMIIALEVIAIWALSKPAPREGGTDSWGTPPRATSLSADPAGGQDPAHVSPTTRRDTPLPR